MCFAQALALFLALLPCYLLLIQKLSTATAASVSPREHRFPSAHQKQLSLLCNLHSQEIIKVFLVTGLLQSLLRRTRLNPRLESFLQWRLKRSLISLHSPCFMEQLQLHIFETYSSLSLCSKSLSGFRSCWLGVQSGRRGSRTWIWNL